LEFRKLTVNSGVFFSILLNTEFCLMQKEEFSNPIVVTDNDEYGTMYVSAVQVSVLFPYLFCILFWYIVAKKQN
jgi:hypothetical protein